jgi:hypothetical protein
MITFYDAYLVGLLIVKLVFIGAVIKNRRSPTALAAQVVEVTHHLFTFLMACLLIYLFRPRTPNPTIIDQETKIFLFTFGILTFVDLYKALF